MPKVELFFYVNKKVLSDIIDTGNAELYGYFRIGTTSHFNIWDKRYYKFYRKPYDYYPRGRVVYKYKENKYILYTDKCIDDIGITEILKVFELENENVIIDRLMRIMYVKDAIGSIVNEYRCHALENATKIINL